MQPTLSVSLLLADEFKFDKVAGQNLLVRLGNQTVACDLAAIILVYPVPDVTKTVVSEATGYLDMRHIYI